MAFGWFRLCTAALFFLLFCFREKKHQIEMTAKLAPKLLGRFHAWCELPLPAVSWVPACKQVQKAEYRDFINALPQRISAVQQLGDFATEFGKTQLALFVFHSNRLERAIAPDHVDGRIVAAISASTAAARNRTWCRGIWRVAPSRHPPRQTGSYSRLALQQTFCFGTTSNGR
jgi:hypothetical protein